jgi:hypothetical protein
MLENPDARSATATNAHPALPDMTNPPTRVTHDTDPDVRLPDFSIGICLLALATFGIAIALVLTHIPL